MEIPIVLVLAFTLIFCIVIFYVFYLNNKNFSLRNKIKDILHQKAEIGNFLGIFSKSLKDIDDIDSSMLTTARYIADLVEAEAICIYEVKDDYLLASGICGAFPLVRNANNYNYVMTKPKYILESLRRDKIMLGEGVIGKVGEAREGLLIEDASTDSRFSEFPEASKIYTVMIVPMVSDAKLTGVICAVNNRRPGSFTPEQFGRLRFISSQVILAQNLVQVYADMSKQQRIHQELEFARQLQATLLPETFPAWDLFAVEAFTSSSKEVNGDFYDFVEIDNDRLLVVVGDACGKGIPACMLTAMTRSSIRSAVSHFSNLEDFLKEINYNLFRDTDEERFVTLACCLLDRKNSLVEYARAGHTELLTFVRGHIRKIYPDGSALGILPNEFSSFDTICLEFDPDMSILLFTDGITEAINTSGEEFGLERLQNKFRESRLKNDSPKETLDKIMEAVTDFSGDDQIDDQTMIMIKHI